MVNVFGGIYIKSIFVSQYDRREYFAWIVATASINAGIIAITIRSLLPKKWRDKCLRYVMAMQVLNIIPVVLALRVWPGGLDGGAMAWCWFVAPPISVLGLSAIILFCLYLIPPG
jgi:hypothetical protein